MGPGIFSFAATRAWLGQRGPEGTVPLLRMVSHLLIVAVAIAVLWVSRLQLPNWELFQVAPDAASGQTAPHPPVALLGSNTGRGRGTICCGWQCPLPFAPIAHAPIC